MARLSTDSTPYNASPESGKYTLLCRLASGGMGEVYVALMSAAAGFEKIVVIKRLLPELSRDAQFVKLFVDEARLTARLSHPNICQVFELAEIGGEYYLVMEYLEGLSLAQLFRRHQNRGIDPRVATGMCVQACHGLAYAHSFRDPVNGVDGVIHRDVSPQNLMLTVSGLVKVLDFGVAKLRREGSQTVTGNAKGKYAYMAPEQLRCEVLDQRADIFAMGVVLFELISGKRLFRRKSELASMQAIVNGDRPSLLQVARNVPRELSSVLDRALSVTREPRYPNARAFAEGLQEAMAAHGGPATLSELAQFLEEEHQGAIDAQRARIKHAIDQVMDVSGELEKTVRASMAKHRLPLRAPTATETMNDPLRELLDQLGVVYGAKKQADDPQADGEQVLPSELAAESPDARPGSEMEARPSEAGPPLDPGASVSGLVAPKPPENLHSHAWLLLPTVGLLMALIVALVWYRGAGFRAAHEQTDMTAAPRDADISTEADAGILPDSDVLADAAPPADSAVMGPDGPVAITLDEPTSKRGRNERDTPAKNESEGHGYLTIDATPYADIYIDNRKIGVTPLVRIKLPVGEHRIRARTAAGKEKRLDVRIKRDRTSRHRITF